MKKDLTSSTIARQNILNNPYALTEIQKAVGLTGILYKGEYTFTKKQLAAFFEINERSIDSITNKFADELAHNGYALMKGNDLKMFKLAAEKQLVHEVNFANKTVQLSVFNFRALLNISMLLTKSDKAKQLRSIMLDITIDVINKRTGGGTKYINQRDSDFLSNLLSGEYYKKEFTSALADYVDMGLAKYPIYTDKVYKAIFKEDAREYRKVLKLQEDENVRHTMYSEVLDLISSFEMGFADALKDKYKQLNRKLTSAETDELFFNFEHQRLWEPLREKARHQMASRDMCFRDVIHEQLSEYIDNLSPDDFNKFIGERSMDLSERLDNYIEALKRLKTRG